ncbi:pentapeptide repeat-containing protein, partial [Vibrio cholerae]|nr:pentapeptide repeat-containing protein [Vibrio cholerae]
EIESALFSGFFNLDSTRQRLNRDYKEFTESLVKIHSDKATYSYIKTQYYVNNKEGTSTVIQEILDRLDDDKPILFLIEAAAGFGKTCSAYELVKEIVNTRSHQLPLFSELSRNRQAKIFRYVLLDEIDRSFPLLSSGLVRSEIKSGKVPVILDGFDELLHESATDETNNYESTEPMLDTISELLINKAKVVLTTRRTAIFDGDEFHQWIANHENDFEVIRLRIQEPCVEDWLSPERLDSICNAGFPIENLSNPVLLSFLRCISDDEFNEVSKDATKLVDKYFDSMMERERKRQDLMMTPNEQYQILRTISDDMIEFDYTSESRDYIYSLILENNQNLIEKTRRLYPADARPTTDELVNKLTSHALLDRKGKDSQGIGFVNEFVLGNFCADNIIDAASSEWDGDKRFIEPAIQSYLPRTLDERNILWESLKFVLEFINGSDKLKYNLMLTNKMLMDLNSETIEELTLCDVKFGELAEINVTVFISCKFSNCDFNMSNIKNATFINCDFYQCTVTDINGTARKDIHFAGCASDNEFIALINSEDEVEELSDSEYDKCEIYVLEKFYPRGSQTFYKHRPISAICSQNKLYTHYEILKAIEKLKLSVPDKRSFLEINIETIGEIKLALGRA